MAFNNDQVTVTPWPDIIPLSEVTIRRRLSDEGLSAYGWGNDPGDSYAAHSHSYNKVIYVVRGEITFGLPDQATQVVLEAGDRLFLPMGTRHSAMVGPSGVYCLEAHC
jgi:quercetin dioxygenase-like cupin family protein